MHVAVRMLREAQEASERGYRRERLMTLDLDDLLLG
jgi:hypothetical protein